MTASYGDRSLPVAPLCRQQPNGALVAVWRQPRASQAALIVQIDAGSNDEPAAFPGLAHFLEHLLFLGGEHYRDEQRLMPYVQAGGGRVNASTGLVRTRFFCEVSPGRLEEAGRRLLDMLVQPRLALAEQVREREVLDAEYQARAADAGQQLQSALLAILAPEHACSAFHAGDRASLPVEAAAFQQALRDYHGRFYRAAHCRLMLVGPQPVDELLALGERLAELLPAETAVTRREYAPIPAAPVGDWQLQLPSGGAQAWLGLVLESRLPGFVEALDWLVDLLDSALPNSLAARLGEQGWAGDVRAQLLYRHEGQAILALSGFLDTGSTLEGAQLRSALFDWLDLLAGHLAEPGWLAQQRHALDMALINTTPLEAGQQWLARLDWQGGPVGLSAVGIAALRALLACRADWRTTTVLAAPSLAGEPYRACGFALRMRPVRLPESAERLSFAGLPHNPLLTAAPHSGRHALPSGLCRLPWPDDRASLVLRWSVPAALSTALGAWLQERLRGLGAAAAQVGMRLEPYPAPAAWQVRLHGPADGLPRTVALLLDNLSALPDLSMPELEHWRARHARRRLADMPIRRLLHQLPTQFWECASMPAHSAPYRPFSSNPCWQGMLCGLSDELQAEALGAVLQPLPAPVEVTGGSIRLAAGRQAVTHAWTTEDAALVLFCPAPPSAAGEAAWRWLARWLQPAFYRRLREERQLGYGLFCDFHSVEGCAGLLFAVQSPVCAPAGILTEIEDFLTVQGALLARLDGAFIAERAVAIADSLAPEALGLEGWSGVCWQRHLRGEAPTGYPLRAALGALCPVQLQEAHRALQDARHGWLILASREA